MNNKPEDIAGKKLEKGKILGEIRKNTSLGKILVKREKGFYLIFFENSEKYSTKFGKIVVKKNRKIHVRAFFSSFFRFH